MEELFFSEPLRQKMKQMRTVPLTVLEAPAGYGKTTAVRMALKDVSADRICWYTAIESVQDSSVEWAVRQLRPIDEDAAEQLWELAFLNRSNAAEAGAIISGITSAREQYIVIDNFQYVVQNWQPQVLAGIANRRPDGLHVIFISQNFGRLRPVLSSLGSSICSVSIRELLLGRADIKSFAQQMGVTLDEEEAAQIYRQTEGWAVAVSLYLESICRHENAHLRANDTDGLLYELFWKHMSQMEQELLLQMSAFERVHPALISQVFPREELEFEQLPDLLARVPLVSRMPASQIYFPHEILRKFLLRQLDQKPVEFQRKVYHRAGVFHRDNGRTKEAVNCFYKVKDYEGILGCELVGLLMERFDGVSYTEAAKAVLRDCPPAVQKKYLLSVLRLCYALYAGAAFSEFAYYMDQVRAWIQETGDPQLHGEWLMLSAFLVLPDLEKMQKCYEEAAGFLKEPSKLFTYREPFLFGCTSMWYVFYSVPGQMMQTAGRLTETMKVYNRLTNGHGAGAAELYLAEALGVQGNFEESEIWIHRAAMLAEQAQNVSVIYGAARRHGIHAIYQNDMLHLQKSIEYLENKAKSYPFLQGKAVNLCMVETIRGYLLALMMETSRTVDWAQGDADSLADLNFTNFMIKTCRVTDLVLKKDYRKAIASVEASLQMDPRLVTVPARNFMYAGLALCYLAIRKLPKAAEYLDLSLTIAKQDKNFTFLAAFRKYLTPLFLLPSVAVHHGDAIREIRKLDVRYRHAEESRVFDVLEQDGQYPDELTPREREVAELAACGMRNGEIAETLHISENTVKFHLKTIFQKMNIDRRSSLIELLR